MEHKDTLLTIAEVAIGFAGFSSLIIVFSRSRPQVLTEIEAFRTQNVLLYSLGSAFLAFVPIALSAASPADVGTWRAASATLFIYSAGIFFSTLRRSSPKVRAQAGGRSLRFGALMLSLLAVAGLLGFANTLGLLGEPGFPLFLYGLLLLLFLSALQFARAVFAPPE